MSPIFLLVCALAGAAAETVDMMTFHAPFTALDGDGKRSLSNWHVGGDASIQENFLRLTPDRQSKAGQVWSQNTLDSDEFSVIFQFRLSGQGQRFFGDGIALWISQNAHYGGGEFHGSQPSFTGLGIVLDTFKNAENANTHRDVALVYNDGSRSVDDMYSTVVGCDADMRYFEKRADFSVSNSSRIKVTFLDDHVKIMIDARASGTWVDCADIPNLPLPAHWSRSAYVAMTASTGDLADNHDVLGLSTYTAHNDVDGQIKDYEVAFRARPLDEQHEDQGTILKEEIKGLKKEMEFKLESFNDGLKHSLQKLEKQEQDSEKRIADLEERIRTMVASHVDYKLDEHKETISQAVSSTVSNVESKIKDVVAASGASGGSGWFWPFMFLCVVIGVLCFFVYRKYQELRKDHLL